MYSLDYRIEELAKELEIKLDVRIPKDIILEASQDLFLGYSPNNTWENLAKTFEERVLKLLR